MPVAHAHSIGKVFLLKTSCLLFIVIAILSSCGSASGRPETGSPDDSLPFKKFEMDIQPLVLAFHDSNNAAGFNTSLYRSQIFPA